MKIIVGILFSGENELESCLASLGRQVYQKIDHFVISNLPNIEAHETLFNRFMQVSSEYELFFKLDADMEIKDPNLLANVVEFFQKNPNIDRYTVPVFDCMTDRLVNGANFFRNNAKWTAVEDNVFTDRCCSVPLDRVYVDYNINEKTILHCPNPSLFQAFHFGVHKGVKFNASVKRWDKVERWQDIDLVWEMLKKYGDKKFGFAALGGELALRGDFNINHVNYTDNTLTTYFKSIEKIDTITLFNMVKKIRNKNRKYLPSKFILHVRTSGLVKGIIKYVLNKNTF